MNCSEHSEDTKLPEADKAPLISGQPVAGTVVTISPVDATAQTIVSLRMNKAVTNNRAVQWYINGSRDNSSKGPRLISHELKKGNVVQAVIVDGDKEYRSNEIIIKNTPPVILKARLLPPVPRASSGLTVDLKANDVDNDNISFKYEWTLNGGFAGEENYLDTELKRDDMITVEVTPYDGEDYGRSIKLKSRVFNSLPVISESTPSFDGKTYKYRIAATDPDKDALTYKFEEGPKGMSVDPSSGIMTWEVEPGDAGTYEAGVSVSDNHGGKLLVPFTILIGFEEE